MLTKNVFTGNQNVTYVEILSYFNTQNSIVKQNYFTLYVICFMIS